MGENRGTELQRGVGSWSTTCRPVPARDSAHPLFVSSSIWTTTPPSQPIQPSSSSAARPKNPAFSSSLRSLPCASHLALLPPAGSEPRFWCRLHVCSGIHPPRFPGNGPGPRANLCDDLCQLSAAWLSVSPQQSGGACTLSAPSAGGVTCVSLPVVCCWLRTSTKKTPHELLTTFLLHLYVLVLF